MVRRKRIKVELYIDINLPDNRMIRFEKIDNSERGIPDRLRLVEYDTTVSKLMVKDIIEASFEDMPLFADSCYNLLISVDHLK